MAVITQPACKGHCLPRMLYIHVEVHASPCSKALFLSQRPIYSSHSECPQHPETEVTILKKDKMVFIRMSPGTARGPSARRRMHDSGPWGKPPPTQTLAENLNRDFLGSVPNLWPSPDGTNNSPATSELSWPHAPGARLSQPQRKARAGRRR